MIFLVLRPVLEIFANFVVLVVKAGATYCRRKCFRSVLGRKCGTSLLLYYFEFTLK